MKVAFTRSGKPVLCLVPVLDTCPEDTDQMSISWLVGAKPAGFPARVHPKMIQNAENLCITTYDQELFEQFLEQSELKTFSDELTARIYAGLYVDQYPAVHFEELPAVVIC